MANIFLFANLARSSLSGSISDVAVTLAVQAGGGAQFPSPSAGEQFALTLTDAATGLLKEIVYCTNRTGDTMTVVRGQESYTALNWAANDPIANLWTAGQAAAMLQASQYQAQSANYATDIGSTNAYAGSYTPSISVPVVGMPLRLKINHTNTGPSTFNPGSGAAAIVTGNGSALVGGELRLNLVYEFMWNGTSYELMSPVIGSVPAGVMVDYGGATAPAGWLLCFGQSLVRATYPDLFTAIGTAYGAIDGSHFSLPDLRGRVTAGKDDMGGVAVGLLTNLTMTPNGITLGATGGLQQLAITSGSAAGTLSVITTGVAAATDVGGTVLVDADVSSTSQNVTKNDHTHTTSASGSTTGTLTVTGNNYAVQPTIIVNKIIKAYN